MDGNARRGSTDGRADASSAEGLLNILNPAAPNVPHFDLTVRRVHIGETVKIDLTNQQASH